MMDMTVEEEKQYAEKMRLLQQQQNTQPQTLAPTVESQVSAPVQSQAPAPLGMAANALRTQELTNSFLGAAASPEEIEAEEAGIRAEALRQGAIDARDTRWRSKNLLGTPIAGILNHFKVAGVVTAEEHAKKLEAEGLTKAKAARIGKRRAEEGLAKSKAAQLIATDLLNQEQEGRTEERTIATEDRLIDRTIAAEGRARIDKDKDLEPALYWDGTDPTRVRTFQTNGEKFFAKTANGFTEVYPDEMGLTPYKALTSTARNVKAEERKDKLIMDNVAATVFMNNFSAATQAPAEVGFAATGLIDPERIAGELGLYGEKSSKGNAIQDYQAAVRNLSFEGVKPLLAELGVSPTDADLAISFETAGDNKQNPFAFFSQFKRGVIPMIVAKARLAGVRSEAEISALERELNNMADTAVAKYGQSGEDVFSAPNTPDSNWNDDLESEYQELLRMRGS
jgi:urease gamma subunit